MTAARMVRRWVTVAGRRIHLREGLPDALRDDRPTVVLVHGFVISSRYMRPLVSVLAQRGWRSVAPDLAGLGLSEGSDVPPRIDELARWLGRTLDAAGIQSPVIVVANSMGCQVAVRLAVQEPERVERLVLVGPTFDPSASLPRHALRLLADLPRERLRLWAEHVPDALRAGPVRIIGLLRGAWAHRIEDDLPSVAAPVLVVRGSQDPIAPATWIRRAAALAPDGSAGSVPGAPHAANYSAPAALADAVEPFMRGGFAG
jgi:pimeloyl-ACP methyl ester carboxylesterase